MTSPLVLIINDSVDMRALYRDILAFEGFDVREYPIDKAGLDLIAQCNADLILLDFPLGLNENGWRLLHSLKQDGSTHRTPIILCTTMVREVQEQSHQLEKAEIQVVIKPFEIDDLLATVNRAIRGPRLGGRIAS